ncbi:AmmeMemoRadiSam system protein B [Blastococcus deserti]|uniref:MEMO1 family protein ACFSHS_10415 n=1 Tax=Blastococcus deserti TaxID=2259033 RepID=A0ABW4X9I3_9ACTN
MRVRPAAVAGRFYPADRSALADLVDGLLADVRPERPEHPVAVIAPHAGYRYSGAVAATAYAHLAPSRFRITRVVVLGPAHVTPLRGMAVPSVDAFDTPLGPVEIDVDARTAVIGTPGVAVHDHPHAGEHSIETQLPFLQRALDPGVRALPLLVGHTPPATVAALLSSLLAETGTVAVVSTDLSHYLPQPLAREQDAHTAAAIVARDGLAVGPADACGHWPLRGLLQHAADRGLDVEVLRLATSADAGADPGRVVGYGAFLLHDPPA